MIQRERNTLATSETTRWQKLGRIAAQNCDLRRAGVLNRLSLYDHPTIGTH